MVMPATSWMADGHCDIRLDKEKAKHDKFNDQAKQ